MVNVFLRNCIFLAVVGAAGAVVGALAGAVVAALAGAVFHYSNDYSR